MHTVYQHVASQPVVSVKCVDARLTGNCTGSQHAHMRRFFGFCTLQDYWPHGAVPPAKIWFPVVAPFGGTRVRTCALSGLCPFVPVPAEELPIAYTY